MGNYKNYEKPLVNIIEVKVEKGFATSDPGGTAPDFPWESCASSNEITPDLPWGKQ